MRIGGFQRLTLVDFPGKIAASIFTQGCNFRCGFCHNSELADPQLWQEPLVIGEIFDHLQSRRGKLQGVVITGGEPTVQEGLADFIVQIKDMGFAIKLDTNGSHPEVLSALFDRHLIDYIAMDIKSSLAKYPDVTGINCDTDKIKESIDLIVRSGIPYQFRTTLVKEFCSHEDLSDIRQLIKTANHYAFVFSPKVLDPRFDRQSQYSKTEIELLKTKFEKK